MRPTAPARPATAVDRLPNTRRTVAVVCLGYFLASLAQGPIASILPSMADALGASVAAAGWVMNAYFLTLVGLVLVMGRLGDVVGPHRVFGYGVAIFTAGQLVCGLAGSFPLLLFGRAIQGFASAMILGSSLAIIAAAVPESGRGRAIGVLTMSASASTLFGVWLATWSIQHLSWQWAFLLPLPLGLLATALGLRLRLPDHRPALRRVDWAGAAWLFAALVAGLLALNHLHDGEETFQAGAPYHLGMHLLTLVLLVGFIRTERRAKEPLLSFDLLRDGRFAGGILANGIAHTSMLASAFLVPFLLERARTWGPAETGLLVIIQQAAQVGASVAVGYLYDRARTPLLGLGMMGAIAVGMFGLALAGEALPFGALVALASLMSIGAGGFTTVNNAALLTLAPRDQQGFASGLIEMTRHFGHVVGVSLTSGLMAAALAGASMPDPARYLEGFRNGGLAMGLLAALGVAALLWPSSGSKRRADSGVLRA